MTDRALVFDAHSGAGKRQDRQIHLKTLKETKKTNGFCFRSSADVLNRLLLWDGMVKALALVVDLELVLFRARRLSRFSVTMDTASWRQRNCSISGR